MSVYQDIELLRSEVLTLKGLVGRISTGGVVLPASLPIVPAGNTAHGGLTGLDVADHVVLLALTPTDLTIATGAITVARSHHRVDTEAAAASDDLDTINGGATGRLLILRPVDGARTVVIKHGTGNILCAGNVDLTLDDAHDFAILIYDATAAKWYAR